MGVLFVYFRAPGVAEVRKHMDENDASSPVPATFDGFWLKGIYPHEILELLVGFVTSPERSMDPVDDRLIWPEDDEQNMSEGPWVTVLDDRARDVLADIPADQVPELAERWTTVEEFRGADPEVLREVVTDLSALALRARERSESLFCWMCV